MNNGLYERAGPSATASAAAWANRLLEPATKVSKVYFGLRRLLSASRGRSRIAPSPDPVCEPACVPGSENARSGRRDLAVGVAVSAGQGVGAGIVGQSGRVLLGELLVDRHRQLGDLDAELVRQRVADGAADLVLDDALGHRVRRADDGQVLQHADQAAQAEEGTTVLGDALTVELADGLLPDPAVVNLRVRHLPALVSPDLPAHCAPGSTRHPSGTDVHTVVHILWTEPS